MSENFYVQNSTLAVVTTIANERDNIQQFISDVLSNTERFNSCLYLVFDSVSNDGSLEIARQLEKDNPRLKVLFCTHSTCPTDSYIYGFTRALGDGADLIFDMNGGYRHQPAEMHRFLEAMESGVDCVIGSRFRDGGRASFKHIQRYVLSYYGTALANLVLGVKLSDFTSGFHLFSADSLSNILNHGIHSKFHFMQTEMRFLIAKRYVFREVPITYASNSAPLKFKVIFEALLELYKLTRRRIDD